MTRTTLGRRIMKTRLTLHRGRVSRVLNGLQKSLHINLALRTVPATRREYHDKSFGFRKPREYAFPDCEFQLASFPPCTHSALQIPKTSSTTASRTATSCGMSMLCARMGIVRHISTPWISSTGRKSQRFCLSGMG